jgi:hypothetical protein
MTQEQALKVLKKYIGNKYKEVESFTSYPINAVFPDACIKVRVDYLRINHKEIWGIVFCVSSIDSDICFCDSEAKADVVYGTIKYRG